MKKLLILTAVLMLTASATGCNFCERWCRGANTNACPPGAVYSAPSYNPCDPCAGGAASGPAPMMPVGPG